MNDMWNGTAYERYSAAQFAWGVEAIEALEFRGDERVLDLGCGNGRVTARLACRVPFGSVLGIDTSRSMLEHAQARRVFNMTFGRHDIRAFPVGRGFDVIFSNAALHWVMEHENLQARIFRALRPKGRVRLQWAARGNCPGTMAALEKTARHKDFSAALGTWSSPWRTDTVESYKQVLEPFDYEKLRVWEEDRPWCFNDRNELEGWIDSTVMVPFLQTLPPGLHGRFRDMLVENVIANTEEQGGFVENFRRINISAVRR